MKVVADNFGWPMIEVGESGVWTHFLPVTKIQFEYFLCDEGVNRRFNKAWYEARAISNPRVSITEVTHSNYHQLFMTDITPGESLQYAKWFQGRFTVPGRTLKSCRLMNASDWESLLACCDSRSPLRWEETTVYGDLSLRAAACLTALERGSRKVDSSQSSAWFFDNTTNGESLAHQMLLRGGVLELVSQGDEFSVRGYPPSVFGGDHRGGSNGLPSSFGVNYRRQNHGFRIVMEFDE